MRHAKCPGESDNQTNKQQLHDKAHKNTHADAQANNRLKPSNGVEDRIPDRRHRPNQGVGIELPVAVVSAGPVERRGPGRGPWSGHRSPGHLHLLELGHHVVRQLGDGPPLLAEIAERRQPHRDVVERREAHGESRRPVPAVRASQSAEVQNPKGPRTTAHERLTNASRGR